MNVNKHPFVFRYGKEKKDDLFQYLGADGLPTEKTYASYLESSEEFRAKAKKYAKDNLHLKNSTLLYVKVGYESSDLLEQEILLKREQQLMQYNKTFSQVSDDDINGFANNFKGKSKRVRVIRELHEQRRENFSANFDEKGSSWFTRLEKALVGLRSIKVKEEEEADQIPPESQTQ